MLMLPPTLEIFVKGNMVFICVLLLKGELMGFNELRSLSNSSKPFLQFLIIVYRKKLLNNFLKFLLAIPHHIENIPPF